MLKYWATLKGPFGTGTKSSSKTVAPVFFLRLLLLLGLVMLGATFEAHAQVRVVPAAEPQKVFSGSGRTLQLSLCNAGKEPTTLDLRAHLFQTSSGLALPLGEKPWKRLEVLPDQTILESATLEFPEVRSETRFLVKWLAGANEVLGTTEVLVYPTNLLGELKVLAGLEPLGLLDPNSALKPWLKGLAVEFADLEEAGLEGYQGRLVIAGPFKSEEQMREGLASQLQALARKGVGVVWLQPPPERKPRRPQTLKPSFYTVTESKGAVVVVQAALLAQLSESPQAQLNLIQLARQALHPEPPRLPHLTPEP